MGAIDLPYGDARYPVIPCTGIVVGIIGKTKAEIWPDLFAYFML